MIVTVEVPVLFMIPLSQNQFPKIITLSDPSSVRLVRSIFPPSAGNSRCEYTQGVQVCTDELQQPLVPNSFRYLTHQFVVIDSIEEFLQIEIHHPAVACSDVTAALALQPDERPGRKP